MTNHGKLILNTARVQGPGFRKFSRGDIMVCKGDYSPKTVWVSDDGLHLSATTFGTIYMFGRSACWHPQKLKRDVKGGGRVCRVEGRGPEVKAAADQLQKQRMRGLVGAPPVGLAAALVAVRSGPVLKLIGRMSARGSLLGRPQPIALDPRSVPFIRPLWISTHGGLLPHGHFITWVGIFQEHLLSLLGRKGQWPGFCLLLGTKVRGGAWENCPWLSLSTNPHQHQLNTGGQRQLMDTVVFSLCLVMARLTIKPAFWQTESNWLPHL